MSLYQKPFLKFFMKKHLEFKNICVHFYHYLFDRIKGSLKVYVIEHLKTPIVFSASSHFCRVTGSHLGLISLKFD